MIRSEALGPPESWVVAVGASRDEAAFRALFDHYGPRLKGFFLRGGLDHARADDLAQEVLARLWSHAVRYDPERASADTWVYSIARNARIDLMRRSSRVELELDDASCGPHPGPGPLDDAVRRSEAEAVRAALAGLTPQQRTILEGAYFADQSLPEIARVEGVPLGTVKSRVRLAFERLRSALQR